MLMRVGNFHLMISLKVSVRKKKFSDRKKKFLSEKFGCLTETFCVLSELGSFWQKKSYSAKNDLEFSYQSEILLLRTSPNSLRRSAVLVFALSTLRILGPHRDRFLCCRALVARHGGGCNPTFGGNGNLICSRRWLRSEVLVLFAINVFTTASPTRRRMR